jgi:hypothetical protein
MARGAAGSKEASVMDDRGRNERGSAPARVLLLLLLALPSTGCARASEAGGVIGSIGVVTASVGMSVTTGCPLFDDEDDPSDDCSYDEDDANPRAGLPITAVGLGLLGLGALIVAADED